MPPTSNTPGSSSAIFTDSFIVVEGYRLHVRSSTLTDRQVVILVHGIGVSEKYYRRLACQLARHYTVVAIDLPGYGQTEKSKDILDLDQLATVLNGYITQKAIVRPILIGQSMGCQIISHFAILFPEVARKLILLSPTVDSRERSVFIQGLRLLQDIPRESLTGNFIVLMQYVKFGIHRFLITQRYMIKDRPEEILPLIDIPILIIRGEKDPIVSRDWVQKLLQVTTHGSLQEIPRGPHNFHWKFPKESAQLCIEFITKP